uniref:Uncharacterized protein n=1 Tax=Rhizochromulina marina TaxID=1034831 RepID=A0A7S2SIJ0_9STRA|mmetsp:Transcript_30816/g.89490  ORF Transcript_30816/g.89490 Transcript_30816/m.89490 type:complete len:326 (+) Transcript_30816:242-1219(+)
MSTREIEAFFRSTLGQEYGEYSEVVAYLASVVDDLLEAEGGADVEPAAGAGEDPHPGSTETCEQLAAAICGFFPTLEEDAELEGKVRGLLAKLRRRRYVMSSNAKFAVQKRPVPARRQGELAQPGGRRGPEPPTQETPPCGGLLDQSAPRPLWGEMDGDDEKVACLMELLPPESPLQQRAHVAYLYVVVARRNIEDATSALVDEFVSADEIRRQENAERIRCNYEQWVRDRKEEEKLAGVSSAEVQRATVDKYALRPQSKHGAQPLVFVDESHKEKRTHYRYLNGQRVAFKNGKDKYVLENVTPEWDGGSRGRVKTKGKRGPGWA